MFSHIMQKENVPQRDCSSENSLLVNSVPVKEVIISAYIRICSHPEELNGFHAEL